MSKVKYCLFFLLFLASFCCIYSKSASAKKAKNTQDSSKVAPAWLYDGAGSFPPEKYLQAVGNAATRNLAELQAVRGISSIFGQNVKSEVYATKRMEQARLDKKVATVQVDSFCQETKTQVDLDDMIGIEMKGYYEDAKGAWYAIAVLDKAKTAVIYRNMIEQNIKEIASLTNVDSSDTASYFTLSTYARLSLAFDIARANESYLSRLTLLDANSANFVKNKLVSSKKIQGQLQEISSEIPIYINILGDREDRIKAAFAKSVKDAGFNSSDIPNERYSIIGEVSFEKVPTSSNITHCRYSVNAPFSDTVLEEVLLPYNASGRKSASTYETAEYNAYKGLASDIEVKYAKAFKDYVESIAAY